MDDSEIIELFWNRSETAITETDKKYKNYLTKIAYNILENTEDCQEVLNDTYLKTWNSIPHQRPKYFITYLSKIARSLSVDKYRKNHSKKRITSEHSISLDELSECVGSDNSLQEEIEYSLLTETLDSFLADLSVDTRDIFICRYFYTDSVEYISKITGYSKSKIKSILFRTRNKLREYLQKEGFVI